MSLDEVYTVGRKLLYKELKSVFSAISSLRYAVVKGEVLSQQIYGVQDRRRSGDIDILIDKSNVRLLEEELRKLGFKQRLPENLNEARRNRILCMACSHQIPSYYKEKAIFNLAVDVNYDIFWGEYDGKRFRTDDFLSDTVDMEIYGVTVKTLPIEKAFVQLILHHYKEMNSLYHLSRHNTICTYMFRDIYDMIKNNGERLSVEAVERLGEQLLIGQYIYYMLYYTREIYKAPFLNDYIEGLRVFENPDLLNSYGLCTKERKTWSMGFKDRLDNDQLCLIVQNGLGNDDFEKIRNNVTIFG